LLDNIEALTFHHVHLVNIKGHSNRHLIQHVSCYTIKIIDW